MPVFQAKGAQLTKQQIGRCGELFLQYRLLLSGFESAQMTTDSGIDLVAYHPDTKIPFTIQVKTNLKAKPAGGKGPDALDWWVPVDSPAQFVALVDLGGERVWLMPHKEFEQAAQQRPPGRLHFYMYCPDEYIPPRPGCHVRDFQRFLLPASLMEGPLPIRRTIGERQLKRTAATGRAPLSGSARQRRRDRRTDEED